MSGWKGVIKCEVYIDMEDVNKYANRMGEFQRLVEYIFESLKTLPEVNQVHYTVEKMKMLDTLIAKKIKFYINYTVDSEPDSGFGDEISFDTYEEAWEFINSPYDKIKELIKNLRWLNEMYWNEYQEDHRFYITARHIKE